MPRRSNPPPRRLPGQGGPSLSRPARSQTEAPVRPKQGGGGNGGGRGRGTRRRRPRKPPLYWRIFTRRSLATLFSVLFTLAILGLGAIAFFAYDLPDISKLAEPKKALGIQVMSADGELIKNYGDIYGDQLTFDEFPKPLIDAVLATEDRKFFHHFGVDPFGILRAIVANIIHGHTVQGGSTITQQLAKNVFLSPERTLKRKVQEMLLAFWLESKYSKEKILSIYLNRVYLGAGNYGVDAATRHYFGKSAREIGLPEAALIAGLLKAPSRYSPTADVDLARKRAHQVLINMVDAGTLTQKEADRAFSNVTLPEGISGSEGRSGRYFSDWVVDQLNELLPNLEDDIVIHTTLEWKEQVAAEEAMNAILTPEAMAQKKVSQAAILSMRPNGAVVAMIGGRDYAKTQYNRAAQARRQTGSSFKMFVYLAAAEAGWRPDQIVEDKPITISTSSGPWTPGNYTQKYLGAISLRTAVAQSINTVAVQVSRSVGIRNVIRAARRTGVTSPLSAVPSLALGAAEVSLLEMTGAYAHLASGGMGVRPYGIREIRRRGDNRLLFERRDTGAYIVLAKSTVAVMNSLLSGVINGGTGMAATIGRPAAGKTGTTSDYKDAWFIGYTPDFATGVWVGNDNNAPTAKVTGGNLPAQIWANYMRKAEEGVEVGYLPTDYGAPASLPWLSGGAAAPSSSEAVPFGGPTPAPGQPPVPQPAPSNESGDNLGSSFWDKLFEAGGDVEYTYPSQRRH